MGEISLSMTSIRDCLKYDPDHSACKKLFRQLKRVEKDLKVLEEYDSKSKWKDVINMVVTEGGGEVLRQLEGLKAKAPTIRVLAMTCKAFHEVRIGACKVPLPRTLCCPVGG